MATADKLSSADESYEEEIKRDQSQDSPRAHEVWTWRRLASIFSGGSGEGNETQRGMQSRHLMMIGECRELFIAVGTYTSHIAIGGTIGTGIFLSAGSVCIVHFLPPQL
jgi:amino acid permease